MKNREEFKLYVNKDGEYFAEQDKEGTLKEVSFAVNKPNHEQQKDANIHYAKYMNQYLKEGIMPQIKLGEVLRKQGVWDDEKENKERELAKAINEAESKLKKGGIKLSEAAKVAKDSIKARYELIQLGAIRNNFMNNSAENLSQNHKFNYLVSQCTVYSNNEAKVFKDYNDFLKQDNQGSLLPYVAGETLSKLLYGFEKDYRADWFEFTFLKKHNFVNDKLEFIDKDGNLVDIDGNPVEKTAPSQVETDKEPEFLPD